MRKMHYWLKSGRSGTQTVVIESLESLDKLGAGLVLEPVPELGDRPAALSTGVGIAVHKGRIAEGGLEDQEEAIAPIFRIAFAIDDSMLPAVTPTLWCQIEAIEQAEGPHPIGSVLVQQGKRIKRAFPGAHLNWQGDIAVGVDPLSARKLRIRLVSRATRSAWVSAVGEAQRQIDMIALQVPTEAEAAAEAERHWIGDDDRATLILIQALDSLALEKTGVLLTYRHCRLEHKHRRARTCDASLVPPCRAERDCSPSRCEPQGSSRLPRLGRSRQANSNRHSPDGAGSRVIRHKIETLSVRFLTPSALALPETPPQGVALAGRNSRQRSVYGLLRCRRSISRAWFSPRCWPSYGPLWSGRRHGWPSQAVDPGAGSRLTSAPRHRHLGQLEATQRRWRTIRAPIFTSFSRNVVERPLRHSSGSARLRRKLARL